MTEVLHLHGVMLTLLDLRCEGAVRERVLITYYRHKVRLPFPPKPRAEAEAWMMRVTTAMKRN